MEKVCIMNNLIKNLILTPFNLMYKLSPKRELQLLFWIKQGYKLNLENPKTYNEKLQWIKLNDHNPLMVKCCDKYTVREFVREQGCGDILNDLLWEGYEPADIPFEKLPPKFVIKITHGSTFNIICDNKNKLDQKATVRQCRKWLKTKFLPCYGEWFYGIEKPRVIVEKYIESDDGEALKDYKVFCFNGKPTYIRVDTNRFTEHRDNIFTPDWEEIPNAHMGHGCSEYNLKKPECLSKLLEYAHRLSEPFLHARVDFYIVNNQIIFGELTFTNGAGFDRFSTYKFDLEIGERFSLKE